MNVTIERGIKFVGAKNRSSALDVLTPEIKEQKIPVVLFAHGFKGFKDWGHFPLMTYKISQSGFYVIPFNFSHNGGTVEQPIDFPDLEAFANNTYTNELEDIKAVINWLKENYEIHLPYADLNKIYLIGHSRGGGIGILAANLEHAIKKIVTWAAVSNFENRLPAIHELQEWKKEGVRRIHNSRTKQNMPMNYGFVIDLIENKEKLNIQSAVKNLRIPFLIIHGTKDETVEPSEAKNMVNWNKSATLKWIENANHTFGGKHPYHHQELPAESKEVLKETIDFLKSKI